MFQELWNQVIKALKNTPLSLVPLITSLVIPGTDIQGKAKNSLMVCWSGMNEQVIFCLGEVFPKIKGLKFQLWSP